MFIRYICARVNARCTIASVNLDLLYSYRAKFNLIMNGLYLECFNLTLISLIFASACTLKNRFYVHVSVKRYVGALYDNIYKLQSERIKRREECIIILSH